MYIYIYNIYIHVYIYIYNIHKKFRGDLLRELSFQNIQPNELDKLKFIASKLLNSHAPLRDK